MNPLALGALGGALGLDGTSVGQFMVSRPLVAGAVTGWVVGEPMTGAVIGILLELYMLVSFPTGGARFPEGATATVVAVGSSVGVPGAGPIALALAVGLVWGQVGGQSITWLRWLNGRIVPAPGGEPPTPGRVVAIHCGAMALDFLRGTVVTTAGIVVGRWVVGTLGPAWPLDAPDSVGLALVGAAVSVGILLHDFGGFRRHRLGLAVGIALGLLGARLL